MTGRAEMERHRSTNADFDVLEEYCEPVSQEASRLINVQGITEKAWEAINNITRGAGKRDDDVIRMMMGASEDNGVADIWANVTEWVRAGEVDKTERQG